jgi:hypothetical protein
MNLRVSGKISNNEELAYAFIGNFAMYLFSSRRSFNYQQSLSDRKELARKDTARNQRVHESKMWVLQFLAASGQIYSVFNNDKMLRTLKLGHINMLRNLVLNTTFYDDFATYKHESVDEAFAHGNKLSGLILRWEGLRKLDQEQRKRESEERKEKEKRNREKEIEEAKRRAEAAQAELRSLLSEEQ